ncbi:MAG: multidrug effflux MFS transporter [Gammaproteobacteria bacterium]|nr:multidrug effflux MFS transporter [Gammaproteobacteria bacterium]
MNPPRNFILFVGALIALGPLSLDAYLPAMPQMAEAFGVGIVKLNNTISTYLIGFGFGQFFGGAFSDQVGRKRIGLIGLAVFCAASLAIMLADTIGQVQALRLVQAVGGGFSTVICMAAVRDVYPVEELGRKFATVTMIMLLAPLVAPGIGAFLLGFGWQAIFAAKAAYAAVLLLVYLLAVPETHPGEWRKLSVASTIRQCAEVVTRRVDGRRLPIRYAVAMALSASVFMTFLTNSSFLYIEYFGVAPTAFPVFFGFNVIGMMSANFLSMKRLDSDNAGKYFRRGLLVQAAGAVYLLLIVAAGLDSLWTVVPAIVLVVSTMGVVGPAGSARYMSFFHKLSGSASSTYTTMMFSGGAALGALTGVFFDGSLLPIVAVMVAASLAANAIGASLPRDAEVPAPVRERSAA